MADHKFTAYKYRIMLFKAYALLLFLLIPFISFAQISDSKFRHISSEQGLSNSTINCIFQDSRGFMWLGTNDGLNRYDGSRVTVYKNNPHVKNSLSDNCITCISEDAEHQLWIGTAYTLDRFNPSTNSFTEYKLGNTYKSGLTTDYVTTLCKYNEDKMWVGTFGAGLDLINIHNGQVTHFMSDRKDHSGLSSDSVYTVFQDSRQNFWIGTYAGLCILRPGKKSIERYPIPGLENFNSVVAVDEDRDHNIWVGTGPGGVAVLGPTGQVKLFTHNEKDPGSLSGDLILTLHCDKKGNVWVGTINQGLNLFNPKNNSFYKYYPRPQDPGSLSNLSVAAIYDDNQGNLWIGTHRGGVNLYIAESDKFKTFRQGIDATSLSFNDVKCFFEDSKGRVWVGTDGGGVNLYDRQTNTFRHYKNIPGDPTSLGSDAVQDIKEDAAGNLWVGTWAGSVNMMDPETGKFTRYRVSYANAYSPTSDFVTKMFLDSRGEFWMGTYFGGVDQIDPKTHKFTHITKSPDGKTHFSGQNVIAINEDNDNNIWFGTSDGGLNRYDLHTRSFSHYFDKDVKEPTIQVVFCDSRGRLWIGQTGLYLYDKTHDSFKLFTEKAGLADATIKAINEDDNHNLWISTTTGITRINPLTGEFKQFNTFDGLQGMEFESNSTLKTKDGEMFFGGVNGFNSFYPEQITSNNFIPPVYLTDFQLFNRSIKPGSKDSILKTDISFTKKITLNYNQSSISFNFIALNYIISRNNQYQYKLDNFDKEWQKAGMERKASYTNLGPGAYVFHVKASNNDGVWNNTGASVTIIITPPFWATWWFRSLVVLLVIAAIYSIYYFRVSTIKKQKAELEKQVITRTSEVVLKAQELQIKTGELQTANEELHAQSEELHTQSENLQKLNNELTLQKEQEHLARQDAEKANKAKSIFLATMSHEIRTPMNGVIGMASLLAETQMTHEQREYTDTIINCGESLLNVINDILDFSKIESGKMELEHEDFDLRHTVEEVMDIFAQASAQQKIDLLYHLDEDVPVYVNGDSLRIKQVLINLVNNAVKFTSKGEIVIKVYLVNQKRGGELEIGFSVRDTGIGIPKEKISRLFTAFSQIDSSTTRKYGGTGLGLAICERLVHLMGGEISASSEFGEGSVFSFSIKTVKSKNPVNTALLCDLSNLNGLRVLVVDDNQTNLTILKTQLEHWKLESVTALSPAAALEALAADKSFKLVITDMEMPLMDGVGLAKEIKAKYAKLPIIMLSSIGDETKSKFPGIFSSILVKPVKLNHLCRAIQNVFNKKGTVPNEEATKNILSADFALEHPLNILIAEDNHINQKLIERVLNKLGYKPDMVQNGMEVLEKIGTTTYDMILMDIQMPEMDGLETTGNIRRIPGKQPYIVAMTANAMAEDREICMRAGMDDYLSKPMKLEDLVNVLKKVTLAG